MKFSAWIKLILQVLLELFLSGFTILFAFFRRICPRRVKDVRGKTIVITGAGHGIARRLAIRFGSLGAKIVCVGRHHDNTFNTAWEIRQMGGEAWPFECDVRRRDAVFKLASQIYDQVGDVDILINGAGIYPVAPILSTRQEEILDIFETNTLGPLWMLQALMPSMLEANSGHVVQISSAAAIAPVAHEVAYSASKGAITVMMDGLIEELRLRKGCQVKVTTIHPYYTSIRHDLPIRFELRFDRMSPDVIVDHITKAILLEEEFVSIPSYMWFFINFMRCLPSAARKRWRDIFYCRVWDLRGEQPPTVVPIDEPDKNFNNINSQPIAMLEKSEKIIESFPKEFDKIEQETVPVKITEKLEDLTSDIEIVEDKSKINISENENETSDLNKVEIEYIKKEIEDEKKPVEIKNEKEEMKLEENDDDSYDSFDLGPLPVPVRSGSDGKIVLHTSEGNAEELENNNNTQENILNIEEINSGLKTIAYVDDNEDNKNLEKKDLTKNEKNNTFLDPNEKEFKLCIQVGDEKTETQQNGLKTHEDDSIHLTKM